MNHCRNEFLLLNKHVKDAIIAPFEEEITTLVEKFFNSGQSGGSAPYTAEAISQAVKKLCLQQPLSGVYNDPSEWSVPLDREDGRKLFQNSRLSSIFKEGEDGQPYYLDAIVFNGDKGGKFTGSVKMSNGEYLPSRQYIKSFPFVPKTFYIDVIDYRYDKNKETGELIPNENGDWWEHELVDENQLKEVFEYYDMFTFTK